MAAWHHQRPESDLRRAGRARLTEHATSIDDHTRDAVCERDVRISTGRRMRWPSCRRVALDADADEVDAVLGQLETGVMGGVLEDALDAALGPVRQGDVDDRAALSADEMVVVFLRDSLAQLEVG